MRSFLFVVLLLVVVVGFTFTGMAQQETHRKLDAISARLAEPSPAPIPSVPPEPVPPTPATTPGAVPGSDGGTTLNSYIIEAPDLLTIEVTLQGPKSKDLQTLPNQPISGKFLVRPDGTVGLGLWGNVSVSGLTTDQARAEIRKHLAQFEPFRTDVVAREQLVVSVEVHTFGSKVYYVIADVSGTGDEVFRFPLTGNETVLDAISVVGGLPVVAGKREVWVARPSPHSGQPDQVLPVDWKAITQTGETRTNYQLLPGDRVYVRPVAKD